METFGNQIKQKISNCYSCEKCKYNTVRKTNFDAHILSLKHIRKHNGSQNISNNYSCEQCNYNTIRKSNFDKHILSAKHINAGIQQKNKHVCEKCNKEYTNRSGLWKHNQMCILPPPPPSPIIEESTDNELTNRKLIMILIKENSELKNMMMQVIKNGTNNTNCNNNTNNTFNLKFFLNETCKDAMNLTDFINSIVLQLSDLDNIGEVGFIKGMSNIIASKLNLLGETKRPIHCTDLKREVIYVKDKDKWEKDANKEKMRSLIKKMDIMLRPLLAPYNKNYINVYRSDSEIIKHQDKLKEILGGSKPQSESEDEIIRNISKFTQPLKQPTQPL